MSPLCVEIDAPNGEFVCGTVVRGERDDGMWDLDAPFTVRDEEGHLIRVRQPWDCTITVVSEQGAAA